MPAALFSSTARVSDAAENAGAALLVSGDAPLSASTGCMPTNSSNAHSAMPAARRLPVERLIVGAVPFTVAFENTGEVWLATDLPAKSSIHCGQHQRAIVAPSGVFRAWVPWHASEYPPCG